MLELFRTRIMFGFKAILYLVGFFLLVGITEARHIPVNGRGGSSSRFRPRLLIIRPPPGSNQPNRLVILTNPRLLSTNRRANESSARATVESRNRDTSGLTPVSSTPNRPRSLLTRGSTGQTRSLRNLVNMLRQNQRRQQQRPSSNIARISNTIPRAAPPMTPKASRFGDLNMPSVIEAALQRLREQSKTHGAHNGQRRPAPHSEVSIPRARSPFSFLGGSGAQTSVSQSSSSSSSSTSNESSSKTVVQSGLNTIGTHSHSHSHSSSKSSSSNSSQSFSSSSSSANSHPNFRATGLTSAAGLTNLRPVMSNIQPGLPVIRAGIGQIQSISDDTPSVLTNVRPVLTNVQPAVSNLVMGQANIPRAAPRVIGQQLPVQPIAANIVSASAVVRPPSLMNVNNDMQFHNTKTSSSSSSKTSSDTSSTVVAAGNVAVQSSATSSKSAAETKKTVTTKTVNVTTVTKEDKSVSANIAPPVGSITVQRGPGGMSTITLADGNGDPVVLKASGPVKIQRIVSPNGKVQFLINPVQPTALGEMEREFEAEEIVTTTTIQPTTKRKPAAKKRPVLTTAPTQKKQQNNAAVPKASFIPTSTPFPLPWSTTKRPAPPRPPPAHMLAPPQMPAFEHVLNQISEIANSISGTSINSGAGRNLTSTGGNINTNNGVSKSSNNNLGLESGSLLDSNIISSQLISNTDSGSIRQPASQRVLNVAQGSIPISRTSVNSVTGDAGPVLSSPQSGILATNRESAPSNIPSGSLSSAAVHHTHRHAHGGSGHANQHTHGLSPISSNNNKADKSNTVDSINSMLPASLNGPQPPYELLGQSLNSPNSQNSLPS